MHLGLAPFLKLNHHFLREKVIHVVRAHEDARTDPRSAQFTEINLTADHALGQRCRTR